MLRPECLKISSNAFQIIHSVLSSILTRFGLWIGLFLRNIQSHNGIRFEAQVCSFHLQCLLVHVLAIILIQSTYSSKYATWFHGAFVPDLGPGLGPLLWQPIWQLLFDYNMELKNIFNQAVLAIKACVRSTICCSGSICVKFGIRIRLLAWQLILHCNSDLQTI